MANCTTCGAELLRNEAVHCKTCLQNIREGRVTAPVKQEAEVKPVEPAVFTPPKRVRRKQ